MENAGQWLADQWINGNRSTVMEYFETHGGPGAMGDAIQMALILDQCDNDALQSLQSYLTTHYMEP